VNTHSYNHTETAKQSEPANAWVCKKLGRLKGYQLKQAIINQEMIVRIKCRQKEMPISGFRSQESLIAHSRWSKAEVIDGNPNLNKTQADKLRDFWSGLMEVEGEFDSENEYIRGSKDQ